jgi:hypothetical protein
MWELCKLVVVSLLPHLKHIPLPQAMANLRKLRTKEHLNEEKEEQSGSVLEVLFFFIPLLT